MSLFQHSTSQIKQRDPSQMDQSTKEAIERTRKLCSQIVVQLPHRGHEGVHPKLMEYQLAWATSGVAIMAMRDPFGGFIDIHRAHMCETFLRETDRRYLVMIDNDVVPYDVETILRLCSHDLPVVSGVACAFRPGVGMFACVAVKDETGVARFPTTLDTKVMPAHGVREVECCGAGFLAIRRDVLESLREPAFLLPQTLRIEAVKTGTLSKTEDIYFADQVHDAGHKLFVDFSVQAYHDKVIPLHWPQEQLDPELDAETWDVTRRGLAVKRH